MVQPGIFAKQHLLLFAVGAFLPSLVSCFFFCFFFPVHAKFFETILWDSLFLRNRRKKFASPDGQLLPAPFDVAFICQASALSPSPRPRGSFHGVSGELCLSHVFKEKCRADTKAPRLDLSPSAVMRAIKLKSLVTVPMTRAALDTDRALLAQNCLTKNSSREENKRLCKLSNVFYFLIWRYW